VQQGLLNEIRQLREDIQRSSPTLHPGAQAVDTLNIKKPDYTLGIYQSIGDCGD
jgi:hypothetical protein